MSGLGIDKKIARNTLMLYIRMFVLMLISLYTSRIVLATLGVEDYGIYNVVGGVVAMFSMISGAMVGASQRFISFELGKKTACDVHKMFCNIVSIHIVLAIIVLLIGEVIGIWAINNFLKFSQDRYEAANWVLQFSLLTFLFNVVSIPYNAVIIAYEKMSAFAYISIVEAVLKLVIVYLLLISPFDKLVFYAFLMCCIAILIRFIYAYYCSHHFKECRYQPLLDKTTLKEIMSYTGWNFLGTWAGVCRGQGVNLVLNRFFGAVANAAQGISHQVLGVIAGFVSNFNMAMNPQIVKRYAAGEKESMFKLLFSGTRLSFILLLVVSTPIMVEAPFVMDIWLKEVPEYAVEFLRVTILVALSDSLSRNLVTAVQASGVVRGANVGALAVSVFAIPLAYIFFRFGLPPYYAAFAQLVVSFVMLWVRGFILKRNIEFPFSEFLWSVVCRMFLTSVIVVMIAYGFSHFIHHVADSFIMSLVSIFFSFTIAVLVCFFFGFTHDENRLIISKVRAILKQKFNRP